ncbi:MAG: hypothetical protein LBV67_02730 [Streptococcaceae bacterium]|jgi:hypothetical protein|nr:hypothetical protein [Streptococcaceae bacterium]
MYQLTCKNCGSNDIKVSGNSAVCSYCSTKYFLSKNNELIDRNFKNMMLNSVLGKVSLIVAVVAISLSLFSVFLVKTENKAQQKASINTQQDKIQFINPAELGYENINKVGNWSKSIYDSIQRPVTKADEQTKQIEYIAGTNIDEIIKQVGFPTTNEITPSLNFAVAVWRKEVGDLRIGITILYDYRTNIIKDSMINANERFGTGEAKGPSMDLTRYILDQKFVYDHIENIKGWSGSLYDSITPRGIIKNRDTDIETYVGVDLFSNLEPKLSKPKTIIEHSNGETSIFWEKKVDGKTIQVEIDYLKDSSVIIYKGLRIKEN